SAIYFPVLYVVVTKSPTTICFSVTIYSSFNVPPARTNNIISSHVMTAFIRKILPFHHESIICWNVPYSYFSAHVPKYHLLIAGNNTLHSIDNRTLSYYCFLRRHLLK